MLISKWFLSCALLLIQSVICSGLQQDSPSVNEKTSKEGSYDYHHPPLHELNDENDFRKGKSVIVNEEVSSPPKKSRSRDIGLRARIKTNTSSLEIPVQVVYDTEPNPGRSYPSHTTTSPLDRTTRLSIRRRRIQSNKKADTKQTQNINKTDDRDNTKSELDTKESNSLPTTEFPKRSRESYFKKRTEGPPPRVKILEEKNFVYAHSGNFHYSYLGGDGTRVSSKGSLRTFENNKTGEAVSGSVSYKDNEGNDYSLTYTADENGYRPVGAHLPTPPPLPPAIARALKYIADKSTPSPLANTE